MSDWDIEQIADAYLVDPDDRPVDDARYDPLAADTADEHEQWPVPDTPYTREMTPEEIFHIYGPESCPRCGDTRYVNTPAGYISGVPAYRQEPCPDCNGGAT